MRTNSRLSRPLDVVVHIGMGKTGTSSIQYFLRDNRERLAELGLLYPETPGRARHGRLGLFAKPDAELEDSPEWYRQKEHDPAAFRTVFRRQLFSEIESSGLSRLLFSDEILFGASDPTLRRLRRFIEGIGGNLRLVVYLRRQDDHMVSRYQQGIKIGWTLRLADFARQDMAGIYDYGTRLHLHEKLLAPSELVVRRFEPVTFASGSLHQDFLEAVGVDVQVEDLTQVADRNHSLDAESVEFLRLLNLYRVEHEASTAGLIDNRELVRRLVEVSTGPVLTLPAPSLDQFMTQWEESNEAVARRWFGDTTGYLFRMPRRTSNVTTEQRLDPARLDYFVKLLGLPQELHTPLRRLVEREATAR